MANERDLSDQELLQIGQQLFPQADPQEILDAISQIKQESPSLSNSDIVNMVVHMVVDGQGKVNKMSGLRQLLGNR